MDELLNKLQQFKDFLEIEYALSEQSGNQVEAKTLKYICEELNEIFNQE